MGTTATILIALLALLVVVPLLVVVVLYAVVPVFKALGWLLARIAKYIGVTLADIARAIGAIVMVIVLLPIIAANAVIARWAGVMHFAKAAERECRVFVAALYRVVIAHPLELVGLAALTEGLEQRLPELMATAPAPDGPSRRQTQFEGYTIVGTLQGGGSGSRVYIAQPTPARRASLERSGHFDIDRVVIKSFSLSDGSTLPQIIRENRALPAASRLGLILEHELTPDRFHYVTRFVHGESLTLTTQRLHDLAGADGLNGDTLRQAVSLVADLTGTLERYHASGLWHKDVKPDNIIVHDGVAHLVDFGLITPLRSSITLTTHGTEYFRDPEMVRMALRGAKVHEVDGVRFDIYAAGAVLYSLIENSFPAHGGLSQIRKRCPEALRWIVRRAMADYDKRYASAHEFREDVLSVLDAPDPFVLKPADLPSVQAALQEGEAAPTSNEPLPLGPDPLELGAPRVGARVQPAPLKDPALSAPLSGPALTSGTPEIRVTSWLTGGYTWVEADPLAVPDSTMRKASEYGREREQARRARARLSPDRRAWWQPHPTAQAVGIAVALLVMIVGGVLSYVFLRNADSIEQGVEMLRKNGVISDRPGLVIDLSQAPRASIRVLSERTRDESGPDRTNTVAVVVTDKGTWPESVQPQAERWIAELQRRGFTLRSELPPDVRPEGIDPASEQAATLRTLLAEVDPESAEAECVLRTWLTEHTDVALVVWFSADGERMPWVVLAPWGPTAQQRVGAAVRAIDPSSENTTKD